MLTPVRSIAYADGEDVQLPASKVFHIARLWRGDGLGLSAIKPWGGMLWIGFGGRSNQRGHPCFKIGMVASGVLKSRPGALAKRQRAQASKVARSLNVERQGGKNYYARGGLEYQPLPDSSRGGASFWETRPFKSRCLSLVLGTPAGGGCGHRGQGQTMWGCGRRKRIMLAWLTLGIIRNCRRRQRGTDCKRLSRRASGRRAVVCRMETLRGECCKWISKQGRVP